MILSSTLVFFLVVSFLSCIQQLRGTAHSEKCEQYELIADNWVLQKMSGKLNLPYQAFAWLCIALPSFPVFNKPFLRHPQDSSPATPQVFVANASCGASRSWRFPLLFFSGSPEDSLLQQAPSPSKPCSIHSWYLRQPCNNFLWLVLTLVNTNQPSPLLFSVDTVWQHYFLCVNSHLPPISS